MLKNREKIIIEKYIIEKNTIKEIAEEMKLNQATITKVLKINNVKIRNAYDYEREKLKRDSKGRFKSTRRKDKWKNKEQ